MTAEIFREKIEAAIRTDEIVFEKDLIDLLVSLKQHRPELFFMTEQDHVASIAKTVFNVINRLK
jgi:hypothetical protein